MKSAWWSFAVAGLLLGGVAWAGRIESGPSGMQPFGNADFVLWGVHDGEHCTGPCIRTERQGNMLITEVFGMDATRVKVDHYDLANSIPDLGAAPVPLTVSIPPEDRLVGELSLPLAGEQPMTVSRFDGYADGTYLWTRNVDFHYADGRLTDVGVKWTAYGPPR